MRLLELLFNAEVIAELQQQAPPGTQLTTIPNQLSDGSVATVTQHPDAQRAWRFESIHLPRSSERFCAVPLCVGFFTNYGKKFPTLDVNPKHVLSLSDFRCYLATIDIATIYGGDAAILAKIQTRVRLFVASVYGYHFECPTNKENHGPDSSSIEAA